jgi:hypothetical protein
MLCKEFSFMQIRKLVKKSKKGIDLVHVLEIETTEVLDVPKGKKIIGNGIVVNALF